MSILLSRAVFAEREALQEARVLGGFVFDTMSQTREIGDFPNHDNATALYRAFWERVSDEQEKINQKLSFFAQQVFRAPQKIGTGAVWQIAEISALSSSVATRRDGAMLMTSMRESWRDDFAKVMKEEVAVATHPDMSVWDRKDALTVVGVAATSCGFVAGDVMDALALHAQKEVDEARLPALLSDRTIDYHETLIRTLGSMGQIAVDGGLVAGEALDCFAAKHPSSHLRGYARFAQQALPVYQLAPR